MLRGRRMNASTARQTVMQPSIMKRYCQFCGDKLLVGERGRGGREWYVERFMPLED